MPHGSMKCSFSNKDLRQIGSVKPGLEISEFTNEHAAGGMSLTWRATFAEDADNPYAPPRADVATPSFTGESEAEALAPKLSPFESFAKAVGIVCIILAVFQVLMVLCYAGWVILAKFGAILTPWPGHRLLCHHRDRAGGSRSSHGLTAWYGLRHRRSWTSWTLGGLRAWRPFCSCLVRLERSPELT